MWKVAGSNREKGGCFFLAIFAQHKARVRAWAGARVNIGKKAVEMLWKRCKCGVLIPQGMKACERCAMGQQSGEMSRHMEYNLYRRDKRAAAFYISQDWRKLRALILAKYDGLDPYAYAVQHRIITADIVHHITEIEDDWSRRLDPLNLIPLSAGNHGIISALYKKDNATKEQTQKLLYGVIREKWKEVGGIEKVFNGGV